MSAAGRASVVLSTTLPPEYHVGLALLAAREDLIRGAANGVICRLVREELDRKHAGTWDQIRAVARELPETLTPRQQSEAILEALREPRPSARRAVEVPR